MDTLLDSALFLFVCFCQCLAFNQKLSDITRDKNSKRWKTGNRKNLQMIQFLQFSCTCTLDLLRKLAKEKQGRAWKQERKGNGIKQGT